MQSGLNFEIVIHIEHILVIPLKGAFLSKKSSISQF